MTKKIVAPANSNDTFEKISEMLNTSFENNDEVKDVIDHLDKKNELMKTDLSCISLDDAQFMKEEITGTLASLESVMTKLEQDIKIGTAPRYYEVFATLASVKMQTVKELRTLNKMIFDIKNQPKGKDESGPKSVTNNILMTSKDITALIENAKNNNALKSIEASFEIIDEEARL